MRDAALKGATFAFRFLSEKRNRLRAPRRFPDPTSLAGQTAHIHNVKEPAAQHAPSNRHGFAQASFKPPKRRISFYEFADQASTDFSRSRSSCRV